MKVGDQGSDERLKYDIQDINYGLNEILQINPVSFKYKTDDRANKEIGFIAQDMVSIVPESVYDTKVIYNDAEPTLLAMKYTSLIPVTVKAIQEQQAIIENQQQKITDLESTIQSLITRIENLENK